MLREWLRERRWARIEARLRKVEQEIAGLELVFEMWKAHKDNEIYQYDVERLGRLREERKQLQRDASHLASAGLQESI